MKIVVRKAPGGMTLVEMLVAVAITVVLLAIIGAVFSHASEATGLAVASNEVMSDLRILTRRLDHDFRGLRADMPMAILFEQHDPDGTPNTGDEFRQDRVVFFANGDFQSPDGPAGNMARIFYGQSLAVAGRSEEGPYDRFVLTRRWKLLTADTSCGMCPPDGLWWASQLWQYYDYYNIENGTLGFWKNETAANFEDYYFNNGETASWFRRPNLSLQQGGSSLSPPIGTDAVQRLYLLSDVGQFQVQVWFEPSGIPETHWMEGRWFPDPVHFTGGYFANTTPGPFGFYWNTADMTNSADYFTVTGSGSVDNPYIYWWSPKDLQDMITIQLGAATPWTNAWPKALRFTFTLYDKNRSSFPKGRTFSYIVELPPRER